jgi:outer membrane protein TolC
VQQQAQALELTLGYPVDLSKGLQPWDMPMPTLDRVTELVPSTRTMQIAALQEKALTQSAFLAKRQRYPDLNLVLGITRDEFTRFNVAADRNELVVGFNVSAPLGDSQLKAQEKSARLTAALASTDRELTQRDLKLNLQTLAIDIQNQEKVHAIAQKKLKVSTRIVDQEKLRYNRGQIDLEQWIDAQNTLKDNQLQAIESAVDLTSLILQWQNLSDQLVQKDDVTTTPQ